MVENRRHHSYRFNVGPLERPHGDVFLERTWVQLSLETEPHHENYPVGLVQYVGTVGRDPAAPP